MSASKFTPEVRGGIIERVAAGISLADASREVNVRLGTVKGWLKRGRSEAETDYAEFAQRVEQARQGAAERPQPMDADELAAVVSQMARKGSVQAAKLRWEMLRALEEAPEPAETDEFDELRTRRAKRAAA